MIAALSTDDRLTRIDTDSGGSDRPADTPVTSVDLASAEWTFEPRTGFSGGPLSARVPGCVHDDLLRHGLIDNPYLGDNETSMQWVGHEAWVYRANLPTPPSTERIDLVCDGLDTVASLAIDGHAIANTVNMHRRYRFDITKVATDGGRLSIAFASAYDHTARVAEQVGDLPVNADQPFALIRKMASNFGWDWGPTVVTAGIWRSIRLEGWNCARLASVRPNVRVINDDHDGCVDDQRGCPQFRAQDRHHGRIDLAMDIERAASGVGRELRLSVQIAGVCATVVVPPDADSATVSIDVPDIELWWPRRMGTPCLYDLEVRLGLDSPGMPCHPIPRVPLATRAIDEARLECDLGARASDPAQQPPPPEPSTPTFRPLDSWTRRVGFRNIELDTTPDAIGRGFTLIVNGQPIFARGFNWIPDDALVSRVRPENYRARLDDAIAAGANLIRVWGGGVFEDDEFYRMCDESGLLVWQDFLFACSVYPETPEFAAEVRAEALDNIDRLMSHPSLALWCGNNENFMGYDIWDWAGPLRGRPWGEGYYLGILPDAVRELDPTRPYWPGSPYSGLQGRLANDPSGGCHHSWVAWNEADADAYLDSIPRFVTEFGWQGPPAYSTMRETIGEEHLQVNDPILACHQKAHDGQVKLRARMAAHVDPPDDFDSWHYAAQVVQARSVMLGIDHWRGSWPQCAGAIVWQLNDCWPVISWAAVDASGRRKPVWWAIRDAFADRRVVLRGSSGINLGDGHDDNGPAMLTLINHTPTPWIAQPLVRRVDVAAGVRASWSPVIVVAAHSVATMPLPADIHAPDHAARELIVIDSDAGRYVRAFVSDREMDYPEPRYDVSVEWADEAGATADGRVCCLTVHVTARALLRDLLLQADRIEPGARADCGLVTLLPGETHHWQIIGLTREHSPKEFVFPVLASMGDLTA